MSRLLKLFDDSGIPSVYLPGGWDTTWKAARDASASTPAWMAFHGDGMMQGGANAQIIEII